MSILNNAKATHAFFYADKMYIEMQPFSVLAKEVGTHSTTPNCFFAWKLHYPIVLWSLFAIFFFAEFPQSVIYTWLSHDWVKIAGSTTLGRKFLQTCSLSVFLVSSIHGQKKLKNGTWRFSIIHNRVALSRNSNAFLEFRPRHKFHQKAEHR